MRWLLRVAMCHIALGLSTWRSAPTRRVVLGTAGAALVRPPSAAWAAEDPAVAVGTVTMQAGVPDDSSRMALSADSALYVTVRVVPSNNVGKYVTEGKVPPLATARCVFTPPTDAPLCPAGRCATLPASSRPTRTT